MTVGSLFAGIGGFDLGFERAGFEIKWQVEIDPFCRAVLAKHWPDVRRYEDVRTVHGALANAESERQSQQPKSDHGRSSEASRQVGFITGAGSRGFDGRATTRSKQRGGTTAKVQISDDAFCLPAVDVLCGGFPCQDISVAGAGAGIDGARSGLWREYDRLIGELRPRYVVVENVSALLSRGLGRVLGDLAARGFDAEWDCLPASAFGAPHRRDRVWIVAHARSTGRDARGAVRSRAGRALPESARSGEDMADAGRERLQRAGDERGASANAPTRQPVFRGSFGNRQWEPEPNVGRVAHGVSNRMDRLKGLGNAIVPQIAEWIARRILEAEKGRAA